MDAAARHPSRSPTPYADSLRPTPGPRPDRGAVRRALVLGIAASLIGGVTGAEPASSQDAAPLSARVDSIFRAYDSTHSPGCALGVIRDGEFVYRRGYGMANLELGVPNTPEAVFRTGSVSKQFTAAAVLILAHEGGLSLDDDVRKYLPELQPHDPPVTLDELIHHTSGVRDYLTLMSLAGKRDDDFYTDDEVMSMLARQKDLNFEPGTDWLYSNSGYFLLSQVVKRVTGKSLRQYAHEHIFDVLGMTHTHFQDDHTMIVPDRASGYAPDGEGGFKISMTTLDMVGDGGVFTSVDDLLYWVRNFYDDHLDGGGIVQASLRRAPLANGDSTTYAFGLQHSTYRGLRVVSHGGSFVGFRADITHFPDQRFDVVTLCNVSTANPSAMARRVADVYLGGQMQPAPPTRAGPGGAGRDTTRFVTLPDDRLAAFAGTFYSDELDVTYALAPGDGGLDLTVGAAGTVHLRPTSEVDFAGNGLVLHFQRTDGRVTGFVLQAGRVRNLRFVKR